MDNVSQFEAMSQQLRNESDIVRDSLQDVENVKEEKQQSLQNKIEGVTVPFGIEGLKKGGGSILGRVFEKAGLKNGKALSKDLLSDPNKALRSVYKEGKDRANQALSNAQNKLTSKTTEDNLDDDTIEDDNPFSFSSLSNASDTPLNITKSTPDDNIFGRSVNSSLNEGGDDTRVSSSLNDLFKKEPEDDVDPDSLVQKGMKTTTDTGIEEAGENADVSPLSTAFKKSVVNSAEDSGEKGLSTGATDGIKAAMLDTEEVGGGPEDPVADVIEGVLGATLLFSSIFGSKVSPEVVKTPFLNPTFQAGIRND